jgi:hypothetical protein
MQTTLDHFFRDLHGEHTRGLLICHFEDFVLKVSNIMDEFPESVWRCQAPLGALGASRSAIEYVERELLRGLDVDRHLPDLTLLKCDRFRLSLRILERGPTSPIIKSDVEHRLIHVVGGALRISRFVQPEPEPTDEFDASRQIVLREEATIATGSFAEFRAAVDVVDISTDSIAVFFELRSQPVCRFQWLYEKSTLLPTRILFVPSRDMEAALTILTLMKLGSSVSAPYLSGMLHHPNHLIRLYTLKALLRVNPDHRMLYLKTAESDPHPYVRRAAARLIAESG